MSKGDPRLMILTPQYKKRGFFDFRRRSNKTALSKIIKRRYF